MNFLFFISLFAVTVSSNPLTPLLADPAAFVATFANADPETINKMITLVGDLEVEGETERTAAIDDATAKRGVSDAKNAALAVAEQSLNKAQGNLEAATGLKNELTTSEAVLKAALDKAAADRDASQADNDKKHAAMERITARVEHEKAGFAEVLELLDSVVVPAEGFLGRKLLSFNEANPDAIESVKAQVVALVAAAEAEATASVDADNAAADKLAADNGVHQKALDAHTVIAGQLQSTIIDVAGKTSVRDSAQVERNEAARESGIAAVDATDADDFRDGETARIDAEAVTLQEVRELLQGLLD